MSARNVEITLFSDGFLWLTGVTFDLNSRFLRHLIIQTQRAPSFGVRVGKNKAHKNLKVAPSELHPDLQRQPPAAGAEEQSPPDQRRREKASDSNRRERFRPRRADHVTSQMQVQLVKSDRPQLPDPR